MTNPASPRSAPIARLRLCESLLTQAQTILEHLALEREKRGLLQSPWVIADEPLRRDAQNLLPRIRQFWAKAEALAASLGDPDVTPAGFEALCATLPTEIRDALEVAPPPETPPQSEETLKQWAFCGWCDDRHRDGWTASCGHCVSRLGLVKQIVKLTAPAAVAVPPPLTLAELHARHQRQAETIMALRQRITDLERAATPAAPAEQETK